MKKKNELQKVIDVVLNSNLVLDDSKKDINYILSKAALSSCTAEHNKVCTCSHTLYDAFVRASIEKEKNYLKKKDITDNITVDMRLSDAKARGFKEAEEFSRENNLICPYEKEEIDTMIHFFIKQYKDLTNDPIFVESVKTILNLQLIVFKMKRELGNSGVTHVRYDKNDNPYRVVNPLIRAQKEYEEAKIKVLDFLDKKINGSTTNLNISGVSIKDVLNEIIVIKNDRDVC